jgi:hypothetical protein
MPAIRKITHKPAEKAMTIVEIEAALADARAHGATGNDVPRPASCSAAGSKS